MDKKKNEEKKSKEKKNEEATYSVNPLPYLISFLILFLITLALLTWALDVYYKAAQCINYPSIWCADDWTCGNTGVFCNQYCVTGTGSTSCVEVSKCFNQVGATGLASCLYGPHAPGSQLCFKPPAETGGTACPCIKQMQEAQNCFNGCNMSLNTLDFSNIPAANCPCCNYKGLVSPGCINDDNTVCGGYTFT